MISKRFVLLASLVVALAGAGAIWSTTHHGSAGAAAVTPDAPVPNIAPSTAVAGAVGLFRRPAVAADVPAYAPTDMTYRRADTQLDGARVYLGNRPGRDVCVLGVFDGRHATVEACGNEAQLTTKPMVASLARTTGPNLVAGLAPDGYTAVVLEGQDGSVVHGTVKDNAYAVTMPAPYRSIRLVKSDGTALSVTG